MSKTACFLLLLCAAAVLPAAETWRWRDANGVVHFSDRPVPGAERVVLGSAPKPGSTAPASRGTQSGSQQASTQDVVPYERCEVTSPANDQVFQNETSVPVTVDVQPGLQADHQLRVIFNGALVTGWDGSSRSGTLTDLVRGTHVLEARVVDGAGRALCQSPQISFHIRLPQVRPRPQPR